MKSRLVAVEGPLAGATVELGEEELTIGRDGGNRLVLSDASVSRRHCVIRRDGERHLIEDLDSRHGTRVNGAAIKNHVLAHRDTVTVGSSCLLYVAEGRDLTGDPELPAIDVSQIETVAASTVELPIAKSLYLRPSPDPVAFPDAARAAGDLDALLRLSTAIASIRDPEALERRLLELAAGIIPAERGGVLLLPRGAEGLDDDKDFASVFAWTRRGGEETQVQVSRTISRQVLRDRVGLLSNGVMSNQAWENSESLQRASVHSVLCVPLLLFERATGVLYLDSSSPENRFDARHLELATAIASIAALALDNARHVERLQSENQRLQADVAVRHSMIGQSQRMRDLYHLIARIAPTDSTVLIRGETGTGKELCAHAIHLNSPRANRPFVAVNCAAIPETLIESELFGHEKGAFTGAVERRAGRLELADEGTLFLDEISELPHMLQAKLLRALQERTFERVGGTRPVTVDIRLVAATNRNLEEAVREGGFRQDLYFRLNVLGLTMPPLRERRDDIPLLAEHFARRFGARLKREPMELSDEARACLMRHDWPGNVRELENAVERAVVLGQGDLLRLEDLPESLLEREPEDGGAATTRYHEAVAVAKRQIVTRALDEAKGTITEAARLLGLNSNYLHRLMNNLGLKGRKAVSNKPGQ